MPNAIKVLDIDCVLPGHYITEPDTEEYGFGTIVPADVYDADAQDWQLVVTKTGHVDIPTMTLAMYNGEQYVAKHQAIATVWVLVSEDGLPILGG